MTRLREIGIEPDRRADPSRQRPARHEPARPFEFPRLVCAPCRRRGAALSVGRVVDRRSTNRSRPRVSARSTATGTRTRAATGRSCAHSSTSVTRPCWRCGRSAARTRDALLDADRRRRPRVLPPLPSRTRPITRTSAAGSPSISCSAESIATIPGGRSASMAGSPRAELAFLQDNATPPDIIGVNHYLTSERFLDERVGLYPHSPARRQRARPLRGRGGRARPVGRTRTLGPAARLREVWQRYAHTDRRHGGASRLDPRRATEVAGRGLARGRCGAPGGSRHPRGDRLGAVRHGRLERVAHTREPHLRARRVRHPLSRATPDRACVRHRGTRRDRCTFDHPVLDVPGWWQSRSPLLPALDRRPQRGSARLGRCEPRSLADHRPRNPARRDVQASGSEARGVALRDSSRPDGAARCHGALGRTSRSGP